MSLGRKIGEGGTSEVFEWEGKSKILKLAKPNTKLSDIQREFKNNFIAWNLGLSVPQPIEIIEVNNRPGIIFERIVGKTIKERLFKSFIKQMNNPQPRIDLSDVQNTARLLSEIHELQHVELRPQRELLKWQILNIKYLSDEEKTSVLKILDQLPLKQQICHGDPNPNNLIVRNDELVLIDWNDATIGNPEADVAEFIVMIKFAILPSDTPQSIVSIFESVRETIIEVFMNEYTVRTGVTYNDIDPWILPIAVRKLYADAISEEEKQLLVNEIRERL
ncbi:aminoglycoside phosphotransferase family protein [Ureibacillus acetophenoni]|uniref:Uncharacterized protein (TIGR02172 family) n=1 Tax=Ureibacillus acetophenoni TaxID=614649 RepID=A0A285UQP0_9BACL|nr:aminoglycoside phosphotransferase family protein [Ureibacillus acetophenoni]SOC42571.1 uncharacterized protein (TIGR02172 family) [Ureibacillus acetophenoni]